MSVSVEIGIPAYNEQDNITSLLDSIESQDTTTFNLERITINSDGSSDQTVYLARQSHAPNLDVIENFDRRGKGNRIDHMVKRSDADIFVLLDADVQLGTPLTISSLIAPIASGEATLTSGRPQKISTGTRFDHVMDVSQHLQDYVKNHINDGSNLYACHGRILALHKSLYKKIVPFYSWTGDDAYVYLFNLRGGGTFRFAPKAVAKFKMPQTDVDFIRQQSRQTDGRRELTQALGADVSAAYKIPLPVYLGALASTVSRYPFAFVSYVILKRRGRSRFVPSSGAWTQASSTKKF